MKWVTYTFAVLGGLLKLAFALALLGTFDARFERAVISLLILIYVAIEGHAIQQAFMLIEQAKLGQTRFLRTVALLGSTEFENEEMKELLAEEQKRIDRNVVKGYIRSVFILLIFLAAAFALFGVL